MSDTTSTMSARLATLFPDLEPRRHGERASEPPTVTSACLGGVALVYLALILVAVLGGAFGSVRGGRHRTAVASTQNVNAALSGVATIEPTLEATVAFPMSGTVASVGVKVGDKVSAGQTLAQLETQSLTQTVDQDEATLAQDQLTSSDALSGQSTGSAGSGATGAGGGTGTGTGTGTGRRATPASRARARRTSSSTRWSPVSSPQLRPTKDAVLAGTEAGRLRPDHRPGRGQPRGHGLPRGDLSTPTAQAQCHTPPVPCAWTPTSRRCKPPWAQLSSAAQALDEHHRPAPLVLGALREQLGQRVRQLERRVRQIRLRRRGGRGLGGGAEQPRPARRPRRRSGPGRRGLYPGRGRRAIRRPSHAHDPDRWDRRRGQHRAGTVRERRDRPRPPSSYRAARPTRPPRRSARRQHPPRQDWRSSHRGPRR